MPARAKGRLAAAQAEGRRRAYQDNQKRCQQDWRRRNPTSWRRYRGEHPDYVETNRQRQKLRDRKRRPGLAKMDASEPTYPVKPGNYYIVPQRADLAKMDAFAQKVFLIPAGYADLAKKDSMDGRFAPR